MDKPLISTRRTLDAERLSLRNQHILERAAETHQIVNTEHFVFEMLTETNCDVVKALASLGATADTLRAALDAVRAKEKAAEKRARAVQR